MNVSTDMLRQSSSHAYHDGPLLAICSTWRFFALIWSTKVARLLLHFPLQKLCRLDISDVACTACVPFSYVQPSYQVTIFLHRYHHGGLALLSVAARRSESLTCQQHPLSRFYLQTQMCPL